MKLKIKERVSKLPYLSGYTSKNTQLTIRIMSSMSIKISRFKLFSDQPRILEY